MSSHQYNNKQLNNQAYRVQTVATHNCDPLLRKWRQENCEFEASLGNIARICLTVNKRLGELRIKMHRLTWVHQSHVQTETEWTKENGHQKAGFD